MDGRIRETPVKSGFFEQRDTQNLENLVQAQVEIEMLLQDGHQQVSRQRHPFLGLHSVLGGAVKSFDPEMLFDLAEE